MIDIFSLQDEAALIFRGCPDAVEPYLTGNLLSAGDALELVGQDGAAANVRGEHFAAIGDTQQAARAFERAGRLEDAASLLSDDADAASCSGGSIRACWSVRRAAGSS